MTVVKSPHHEPLAPMLGRLTAAAGGGPFSDLRLKMVDQLVESFSIGELSHERWVEVWEETVSAVAERILADATAQVNLAARIVRYPRGRLDSALPRANEGERLVNSLLANGLPLERLDSLPNDVPGTRRRGATLDACWHNMLASAGLEMARWRSIATKIRAWQRPWRPLVLSGVGLTLVLTLVALWVGGIVNAPTWFSPVIDWFWGLPWL